VSPDGAPIWQPLSRWRFRTLWIASIISNCGSWIYTITVQWKVTSMSMSPSSVSMVLVAASLPQFLFLLPAGVLCDLVDRRRLLLAAQLALILLPSLLGIAIWAEYGQVWILFAVTFLIGVATAFSDTAWQSIIPRVVPKRELVSAVALGSISINVSRSVGPAVGAAVVTTMGAVAACFVSAASVLGAYWVALRLRIDKGTHPLSIKQLVEAAVIGLQFVRQSPQARAILIRETTFVFFASILWALLPALARMEFGMGAAGYGTLFGCVGLGALGSAVLIPLLQRKFSGNQLAVPATIFVSCSCILPALLDHRPVLLATLFLGGMGWAAMLVICNTAMQMHVPAWVRGRALSAQALVLFGTLSGGGLVWGFLADHVGVKVSFLISGFGLLATLVLHCRYALTFRVDESASRA
jgi:MFS family permease